MHVYPAPGLTVRDPETYIPLPAEGADVPASEYWMRRLQDGDVILSSIPKAVEGAAPIGDAVKSVKPKASAADTGSKS